MKKSRFSRLISSLASIKLAVVVILSIAALTSIGTVVESMYDAHAASLLVYRTPWMFIVMGLFAINLTAVMVDRWPWKTKHIPFILAHIGILLLLLGSFVTYKWGLDGSMRIEIGQKNKFVTLPQEELTVWASFDGDRYSQLLGQEVNYFLNPPQEMKTVPTIPLQEGELKVTQYEPYTIPKKNVVASDSPGAVSAVRFQLKNDRVSDNNWLVQRKKDQPESVTMGLATLTLWPTSTDFKKIEIAARQLFMKSLNADEVEYIMLNPQGVKKTGRLKIGDALNTGWMALEFKLIDHISKAEERWEYKPVERPGELTTAAIEVDFQGQKTWIGLDNMVKFFTTSSVYLVSYGRKKLDLGFNITLQKFEIENYEGLNKAKNYKSQVSVSERFKADGSKANSQSLDELLSGEVLTQTISMNEPLKTEGLTFYQASFQQDPQTGAPVASILSINYDPGRWLKYLGSLIICLGVIALFYQKRKMARLQYGAKNTP